MPGRRSVPPSAAPPPPPQRWCTAQPQRMKRVRPRPATRRAAPAPHDQRALRARRRRRMHGGRRAATARVARSLCAARPHRGLHFPQLPQCLFSCSSGSSGALSSRPGPGAGPEARPHRWARAARAQSRRRARRAAPPAARRPARPATGTAPARACAARQLRRTAAPRTCLSGPVRRRHGGQGRALRGAAPRSCEPPPGRGGACSTRAHACCRVLSHSCRGTSPVMTETPACY